MSGPAAGAPRARVLAVIGARCAGKSTVGRLLAHRLHSAFADLDDLVLANLRSNADAIYTLGDTIRRRGWEAFRAAEERALALALHGDRPRLVLATGGGSVEREANRERLARETVCVWLDTDPEVCLQRLARFSEDRPPLESDDPVAEFAAVRARREPLYAALVTRPELHVRCRDESPEAVRDRILAALGDEFPPGPLPKPV